MYLQCPPTRTSTMICRSYHWSVHSSWPLTDNMQCHSLCYDLFIYFPTEKLAWIESPESQVTVQPNQPLTVTCKASGAPAPRIEWGRFTSHYQRLTELDGRTTFTLSPSEIRNGDSYICMARSTFICCPDKNVQTPIVAKFTVSVSTSGRWTGLCSMHCVLT